MKRLMWVVAHKEHLDTFTRAVLCKTRTKAIQEWNRFNNHPEDTPLPKGEGWKVIKLEVKRC